jgi:hypothetical protein
VNKPSYHVTDFTLPAALEPLRPFKNWIVWRYVQKGDNWTKPPYQSANPQLNAAHDDPATWSDFDTAVAAIRAGQADGIGFCFTKDVPFAGIDIDRGRNPKTGDLDPWVVKCSEWAIASTYCEVTPSGCGIRIWGAATGAEIRRKINLVGSQFRPRAAVELYRSTGSRYLTITGEQLGVAKGMIAIDRLIDWIEKYADHYAGKAKPPKAKPNGHAENLRDGVVSEMSEAEIEQAVRWGVGDDLDRSEVFHGIVWSYAATGDTANEIIAKLGQWPNGIAAKYLAENRLREEVMRSLGKRPVDDDDDQLSDAPGPSTRDDPLTNPRITLQEVDVANMLKTPPDPRQWLYGNQFCRRFHSELVGTGGTGKTALRHAQFVSMATGIPLLNDLVFQRSRVLVLSLEDGQEEMHRRFYAVTRHYGIAPEQLDGWLYCWTLRGYKMCELDRKGRRVTGPLDDAICEAIERLKPDVLAIDPLVKLHGLSENNAGDMDFVADRLAQFAITYNIATDATHHVGKGLRTPGDPDSGRGSSAIKDAGRLNFTLKTMDEEEAKSCGVAAEERYSYVRLDSAKVNITKHARDALWYKLVSVRLDNATVLYPNGDEVQTVAIWNPPSTAALTDEIINDILDEIEAGPPRDPGMGEVRYSSHPNATHRAWQVVQRHCANKSEKQCKALVQEWLASGLLYTKMYTNPRNRHSMAGLYVDDTKRPPRKGK